MDTNPQVKSPLESDGKTSRAQISQAEATPTPDELISPEAVAWAAPISEEWGKIYSRFKEDTEAMIERGGGRRRVGVQS